MTLLHTKAAVAALWLSGVALLSLWNVRIPSISNGAVIAAIALLPPIVLWFWWNEPSPTMSESIHEVRNAATVRRPSAPRD